MSPDLFISFENKPIQFVFSFVQVCDEAPHQNAFYRLIEKIKSATKLLPAKKDTVNYFYHLYNDNPNHFYSMGLGRELDKVSYGHKHISLVYKAIFYFNPHRYQLKARGYAHTQLFPYQHFYNVSEIHNHEKIPKK